MPINYKDYPPTWHSVIRPRILERAGHKCEQCGVENYALIHRGIWDNGLAVYEYDYDLYPQHQEKVFDAATGVVVGYGSTKEGHEKPIKIILTVAHLCHFPMCDDDEHLRALCQRCHLRLDIAHHKQTRKARRAEKAGQLALFENVYSRMSLDLEKHPKTFKFDETILGEPTSEYKGEVFKGGIPVTANFRVFPSGVVVYDIEETPEGNKLSVDVYAPGTVVGPYNPGLEGGDKYKVIPYEQLFEPQYGEEE